MKKAPQGKLKRSWPAPITGGTPPSFKKKPTKARAALQKMMGTVKADLKRASKLTAPGFYENVDPSMANPNVPKSHKKK